MSYLLVLVLKLLVLSGGWMTVYKMGTPNITQKQFKKVSFYFCLIVCRIREPCQRSRGWHRLRRSHSSGSLGNLQADVQCWKTHSLWKGLAFGYFGHIISVLGHFFHTLTILFITLASLLNIWPFCFWFGHFIQYCVHFVSFFGLCLQFRPFSFSLWPWMWRRRRSWLRLQGRRNFSWWRRFGAGSCVWLNSLY